MHCHAARFPPTVRARSDHDRAALRSCRDARQPPTGDLARRLADVKFDQYAAAPGYSEGPTWNNGELLFCSGARWRVDAQRQAFKFLEIAPAGTVLRADGHLLICDNLHKALLDLVPDGKLGVVGQRFEPEPLRSLKMI